MSKTIKRYVFVAFDEHSLDGVRYSLFDSRIDEDDPNNFWAEYKFLAEIDLPFVSKAEVAGLGAAQIDREIADLSMQIEKKKEKKKMLLSLEHDGGDHGQS